MDYTLPLRSLSAVWHPCTQMKNHEVHPPLPIERAQGLWLYEPSGQRYLDAISSWWVNLFGHNHPKINQAIQNQLNQMAHTLLAGVCHESATLLAEKLSQLSPKSLQHTALGHCLFASDGACAVEISLKLAVHYWYNVGKPHKNKIICLQGSYHGETMGALSVTDLADFKQPYQVMLRKNTFLPVPDLRHQPQGQSQDSYVNHAVAQVAHYLEQHAAETAAFIVEPLVQCAAGMVMYPATYLQQVRALCNQHQVLLIADEIAVGMGRTGALFACETAKIQPDILCLSKGITGGYLPLSVVLTHDTVYDAFYSDSTAKAFLHSHSYTGNPLACRAALATLEIFEEEQILHQNKIKQARFLPIFNQLAQLENVKHLRNQGNIWAFDVQTKHPNFSLAFSQAALDQGMLLRPLHHTVYFMPPYIIEQAQFSDLVDVTRRILETDLPTV